MEYNISPVKLLDLLAGNLICESNNVEEYMEKYEREHSINIPSRLKDFMKAAYGNPVLETADVWVQKEGPKWYFLYEEIQEMLDEDIEYHLKNDESDYNIFAKTPKEKWGELICDYLNVGSDYAAGVVTFGIRASELNMDNPPIYMQHEAEPFTKWDMLFESLSDYLLYSICDALLGVYYNTAQYVLEEYGWKFESYGFDSPDDAEELFCKYSIDVKKLNKIKTLYPADWQSERFVCYNENLVIIVKAENSETEVLIISK